MRACNPLFTLLKSIYGSITIFWDLTTSLWSLLVAMAARSKVQDGKCLLMPKENYCCTNSIYVETALLQMYERQTQEHFPDVLGQLVWSIQ